MKVFFDTEFTGLHKETTLISIGLVAENGDKFYAELNDYDESQVDDWINKNVIENLMHDGINESDCKPWYHFGDYIFVRNKLRSWLDNFGSVEFISDVCHYDFVLLIDLVYGHAMNMPYGVHNAACHDINQDIASFYGISETQAFDKSRESILNEKGIEIKGLKHNAMYDAIVISEIYKVVRGDKC